jgi:DNA (cytosine-5)-methyltransferase 1
METAIRGIRPRYVLVENVSALVRDDRAFGTVLRDLHTLGFDAEWATLRASDFGAPHPRERVYLLAYTEGVDGQSRDRVGESRDGEPPFAIRGLPSVDAYTRRRAASEWLAREPRVDRLADGIPDQVDRLRVIGNAVVPQVAEHIGRLMMGEAA